MNKTVNVSVRIDEKLKNEFDSLLDSFGMSMSTAMLVFIKKVVNERKIPFEISSNDDFYNPYNQKIIAEAFRRLDSRKRSCKNYGGIGGYGE